MTTNKAISFSIRFGCFGRYQIVFLYFYVPEKKSECVRLRIRVCFFGVCKMTRLWYTYGFPNINAIHYKAYIYVCTLFCHLVYPVIIYCVVFCMVSLAVTATKVQNTMESNEFTVATFCCCCCLSFVDTINNVDHITL